MVTLSLVTLFKEMDNVFLECLRQNGSCGFGNKLGQAFVLQSTQVRVVSDSQKFLQEPQVAHTEPKE